MERNKKDKPELEKQRSEQPEEQNATEIMKSEEMGGSRKNKKEQKEQTCENSMEQNEAKMKSKEKNGGKEDEIELKGQICEKLHGTE